MAENNSIQTMLPELLRLFNNSLESFEKAGAWLLKEDGDQDQKDLTHALEDLKPVRAHLVTIRQLTEADG